MLGIFETFEQEEERLRRLKGREIALATMPGSPLWLKANAYRRKIGLGTTRFHELKNLGKFDKGTDPATFGSSRIRIHAWWSYSLQEFIPPGLTTTTSLKHRRTHNGKSKKNHARKTDIGTIALRQASSENPPVRSGDASGGHLPGPAQQQAL